MAVLTGSPPALNSVVYLSTKHKQVLIIARLSQVEVSMRNFHFFIESDQPKLFRSSTGSAKANPVPSLILI